MVMMVGISHSSAWVKQFELLKDATDKVKHQLEARRGPRLLDILKI